MDVMRAQNTKKKGISLSGNLSHVSSQHGVTVIHTQCLLVMIVNAHVRKDRLLGHLPLYRAASNEKLGGAWERG